jgi:type IV secretory pathway protease TraF
MGRPLPRIRLENHLLAPGEGLFLSDHNPDSFDSRYFGPQKMAQIVEVVNPVLTFGNPRKNGAKEK